MSVAPCVVILHVSLCPFYYSFFFSFTIRACLLQDALFYQSKLNFQCISVLIPKRGWFIRCRGLYAGLRLDYSVCCSSFYLTTFSESKGAASWSPGEMLLVSTHNVAFGVRSPTKKTRCVVSIIILLFLCQWSIWLRISLYYSAKQISSEDCKTSKNSKMWYMRLMHWAESFIGCTTLQSFQGCLKLTEIQ